MFLPGLGLSTVHRMHKRDKMRGRVARGLAEPGESASDLGMCVHGVWRRRRRRRQRAGLSHPHAQPAAQTALMRRTAGALRIGIGGDENRGTARGSRGACGRCACSAFARWRCDRCWYGAGDGAVYAYAWGCWPGCGGATSPGEGRLDETGQKHGRRAGSRGSSGVPAAMSSIRRGCLRASEMKSCEATSSARGPM